MKTGLTVQDNHKPVFTNCLNYQPVVKEEQPANTYVFTVSTILRQRVFAPLLSGGVYILA